ncbi:uncharacterized protein [Solanum lycopersicum]|uniref:uncharacterized protein n=1 Tax=Solanum lycopersicum TaxID=4081 RepID=UPI003748C503
MGSVTDMVVDKKELVKEIHRLAHLVVKLEDSPKCGIVARHNSKSSLVVAVKSKKHLDPLLMELKETVLTKSNESFYQREDGVHRHQAILCIPDVYGLREFIIEEEHGSWYSIQPGATKMDRDLRETYWWNGMKKDIELLSVQIANK